MAELLAPIPTEELDSQRQLTQADNVPVNPDSHFYNEGLVALDSLHEFPDATTYYSHPNGVRGYGHEIGLATPLVRAGVARRLVEAEDTLQSVEAEEAFDEVGLTLRSPAHLLIRDALRDVDAQEEANRLWSKAIYVRYSGLSEDEQLRILSTNQELVHEPDKPAPSMTGGRVHVRLAHLIGGRPVDVGPREGDAEKPDYYEALFDEDLNRTDTEAPSELEHFTEDDLRKLTVVRRVYYNALTIAGLRIDPKRLQIVGFGDPRSEALAGNESAHYGVPTQEQVQEALAA